MTLLIAAVGWVAALSLLVAARHRAELVARACHEIAGPLNAAGLALHAARRERSPVTRLAAIEIELRRASRALADLDAARSGRRAPDESRSVDVGALLSQQALTWGAAATARGSHLRVAAGSGLFVEGDGVRLAQAVGNLIANALEHGGEQVALRAVPAGERVRVEVTDDGPGLPASVATLTDGPRGGMGARGRGLAIAADIARRHGGRLASAPTAQGACLVLDLPRAPAADPEAPTAPIPIVPPPAPRSPTALTPDARE